MNADYSQIIADDGPVIGEEKAAYAAYPHAKLTRTIIGAALEVHRVLGRGFLENVYQNALLHELRSREVTAEAQAPMPVVYKDVIVGTYFADILAEGVVICEIKAAEAIIDPHLAQLLNYLKATRLEVGLLLNFGAMSLQIKRMVKSHGQTANK
jgi:GxxExxY protein